jgi:hypothetical protein
VKLRIIQRGERKDVQVKLVKYDQEALAKSKLDAVEHDVMAFSLGSGSPGNVFVAPGLGPLTNPQFQDAEKWRDFVEHWRQQAEKFNQMAPTPPSVPGTPGAGPFKLDLTPTPAPPAVRGRGNDARWEQIEDRLERLEKLLERLAEQRGGGR